MEEYLVSLIGRMNDTSYEKTASGSTSRNSVSWKAFREAEKIEDLSFVPQLIAFIDREKDKKKRDKAYFVLGHLAKNLNNDEALQFLIQRINKETDKYIIASLLDRIADLDKPVGTDLSPIIEATKNSKWLIRYAAIRAFANTKDGLAEAILIEIIDISDDPHDLLYANATLNKIGTLKAIPYLQKHIKSRKRDVKDSAKLAIEEIEKRN